MLRLTLRYTGALWLLQIVAAALVHMAFDWTLPAVLLTLAYLGLAGAAALGLRREAAGLPRGRRVAAALAPALLWQLPGLAGSLNQVREQWGLTPYDGMSDLLDFAMQTWQTPLMPLLSLLPVQSGVPDVFGVQLIGYYVGLVAAAPLLVLGFAAAGAWPNPRPAAAEPAVPAPPAAVAAPAPRPGEWAAARRAAEAARSGHKKVR